MKKTILLTLAISSAVLVNTTAIPADAEDENGLSAVAEEIEIMRLVLAKSINRSYDALVAEKWPKPDGVRVPHGGAPPVGGDLDSLLTSYEAALAHRRALGFGANRGTQYTSHTRGFYAEGIGCVFTTEASAPVKRIEVEAGAAPVEPDEWAEAADEVRGTGAISWREPWFNVSGDPAAEDDLVARWVVDEAFIDATIDGVLETLGKHGLRMEALPADESIVVAVRMTPDTSSFEYAFAFEGGEGEAEDVLAARALAASAFRSAAGARGAAPMHVSISIAKESIERLSGRPFDRRNLREAATVTVY